MNYSNRHCVVCLLDTGLFSGNSVKDLLAQVKIKITTHSNSFVPRVLTYLLSWPLTGFIHICQIKIQGLFVGRSRPQTQSFKALKMLNPFLKNPNLLQNYCDGLY